MMRLPLFVFLAVAGVAFGEVKLSNPGFSAKETLQYAETVDGKTRPLSASLTLVGDGEAARYEYRTLGAELESVFRVDPLTMLSLSSESLMKAPDATVKRSADYRDLKIKVGTDDLPVTDLGSAPIVLRGFPWEQRKAAKIVYVGNSALGGGSISFELNVVGKETITSAGRNWECWHVTTGLGGALSLMMAKTDWWFAVEGSHPMVKTSGPVGGPGSPMRTLLLTSYQTK